MKIKFNPFIGVVAYVAYHLIITVILLFTVYSNNTSFEFVVNAIEYLFYGMLAATIILSIIFLEWTKKYWYVTLILILIGSMPLIGKLI
jgi:hypothetical protein